MPAVPSTFIVDASGQQWLVSADSNGQIVTDQVSGQPAVPFILLNDNLNANSWKLTIVPNPPPVGESWGDTDIAVVPFSPAYPNVLAVNAPGGVVYDIFIDASSQNRLSTVEVIAPPTPTLSGKFWNLQFEVYTAIVEAMNDLMVLIGRPTQTLNMALNLAPNTPWQKVPKGVFLITNIRGPKGDLRKISLFDQDYLQSWWGSDWENDISDAGPKQWAPVGMGMFLVYPAPSVPQTVTIDGIAYPVAGNTYPYTGSEVVPFHHEIFVALEEYAAHVCRLKEGGAEFQEAMALYANYLQVAKRLTQIETRRDQFIFSPPFGAPAGVRPLKSR